MRKEYDEYIDRILNQIQADGKTKKWIRQSLTEHIEVLIEKHGSMATKHLEPADEVAKEFIENLDLDQNKDNFRDNDLPRWIKRRRYTRRISKKQVFNMPLYHITDGYNPETKKFEIAKGFFALGPVAMGFFAWGGVALGVFSFGGLSLGLILALGGVSLALGGAVGGMAIGGLLAAGGLAISWGLSLGGLAMGHVAIGDKAIGDYVYYTKKGEGNAVEWFRRYMPYFVRYFK